MRRRSTMAQVFLLGRLLLGAFYLLSAFDHFSRTQMLARAAMMHGVPAPTAAVLVAGVLLAIAGITLILGVFPKVAVLSLVLFFVPVSFIMHPFWADHDQNMRMMDMVNF